MKKNMLNEKNLKIEDWVEDKSAETMVRIMARNAEAKAKRENKTATINTRIAPSDLARFIEIADKKAIPYQTLLQSLLHLYVEGKLVDISEAKKFIDHGFAFVEIESAPRNDKASSVPPLRKASGAILKAKSR